MHRALEHYKGQLDVFSDGSYRLAPEVLGRSGALAVAALLSVPLAVLAARRRWAAFVLGGFVLVLALMLLPELFTRFADAVSISQARRAAGFVPFGFALAGGAAVLARLTSVAALPIGLGAGTALQLAYPGDFGYKLDQGGPAIVTWIALVGGAAALVVGIFLPQRLARLDRMDWLTAATAFLVVLPTALHGFTHWDEQPDDVEAADPGADRRRCGRRCPSAPSSSPTTTRATRSPPSRPVYVANALPGHVADTKANRPYERRDDAKQFFRTGDLAIPRRYGATWLVIDRSARS